MMDRREFLAGASAALLGAADASAQTPSTPVSLIVPFAPGGGNDILAREIGHLLADTLKTSIVIDNRSGAGGLVAAKTASTAKPDGATLLFVSSSFITTTAGRKVEPYDVVKDFTPLAKLARSPLLVVASHQSGINSIEDVIKRSKQAPGSLNFVSSGVGSILHLATEVFMHRAGIKMTHVPYTGSGPALMDLVAGRADLFITAIPTVLGQLQDKSLKLIAVTGESRSPLYPDAPTLIEQGLPGLTLETWWGIVGPPNMPAGLRDQFTLAINEAAAMPAMKKRFADEGAVTFRGTSDDFRRSLEAEYASWRRVIVEGNLYTN